MIRKFSCIPLTLIPFFITSFSSLFLWSTVTAIGSSRDLHENKHYSTDKNGWFWLCLKQLRFWLFAGTNNWKKKTSCSVPIGSSYFVLLNIQMTRRVIDTIHNKCFTLSWTVKWLRRCWCQLYEEHKILNWNLMKSKLDRCLLKRIKSSNVFCCADLLDSPDLNPTPRTHPYISVSNDNFSFYFHFR